MTSIKFYLVKVYLNFKAEVDRVNLVDDLDLDG